MAIPTVDPGAEVRSEDHNEIVGLLNGTATYGQPIKAYQFNDPAVYSATFGNQDTTNGLIAAFQYGTVGSATTVVRITKQGILALLRDTGGVVYHLDAYAGGVAINVGAEDAATVIASDAAWVAAFAAVRTNGRGTIQLGPGTYLPPPASLSPNGTTFWPPYMTIRGAGMDSTVLLHRSGAASTQAPILAWGAHHFTLTELTLDGNATAVATANVWGGGQAEISLEPYFVGAASSFTTTGGYDNSVYRVRVTNFHNEAIRIGGQRNSVLDSEIVGQSRTSYQAYSGAYAVTAGGSVHGIAASYVLSEDLVVSRCRINGLRSAAIFFGGKRLAIVDNDCWDNHRELDSGGNGGGHIATQRSWDGVTTLASGGIQAIDPNSTGLGLIPPSGGVICGNRIGPRRGSGTSKDHGIEIDAADTILVSNNTIDGVAAIGLKINSSVTTAYSTGTNNIRCDNNVFANISATAGVPTGGGSTAIAIGQTAGTVTGIAISGSVIRFCNNALYTFGTISAYSFHNWTLIANTLGWTKADAATDWQSGGHTYVSTSHAPLTNQIYQNWATGAATQTTTYGQIIQNAGLGSSGANTGNGLWVIAGTTASDWPLRVSSRDFGIEYFSIFGNGQITIGGPANGQGLTIQTLTELTTIAAAGSTDTAIQMPAAALVVGVSVRVTTVIPTATSFSVGDSGSATRFSTSNVGVAAGSTDPGTKAGVYYQGGSGLAVRLTMNGGVPANNTGRVRVTIHYLTITPPTS